LFCVEDFLQLGLVKEGESPKTLEYVHDILVSEETPVRYRVFQRGGGLDTLAVFEDCTQEDGIERHAGMIMLRQADKNWLLHVAAKFGIFEKVDNRTAKKKKRRIEPPRYVGEQLLATVGLYQYPTLRAISHSPVMSRDGSIVCEEGYHKNLRIYCAGSVQVTVKDKPSRDDALAALHNIKSLLREFPFKNDAHRSVAISLIISAVIRLMLRVVPLFIVSADKHGAGKTTLVHVASIIAIGTKATAIAATDHQEEFRKRLDTVLLAGDQIVNLDNLNWDLESETLAQAVSEPYVNIRVLGKNEQRRVENTALYVANGNNLNVAKDLARRTVVVRLATDMERPDLREFENDVLEEAFKRRTELLESVFTIVRAYINNVINGEKDMPEMWAWGGFNDFTKYVRGPLVWLGEPDPCITCSEATAESQDDEKRRELFESWFKEYGVRPVKVKELVANAIEDTETELARCLRAVAQKDEKYNDVCPDILGKWLKQNKNMVVAGLRLHNQPAPKHGAKWFISKV
jgi:putative DNA primase/helicase